MTSPTLFTIGHSNLAAAAFLDLLRRFGVEAVVDVRSQPVSRFSPHFNRAYLSSALKSAGLRSSFMGDSLGGRPGSPRFYDADGHVRYDRWSASPEFTDGLRRLQGAAAKYRIALLCSEADPSQCHRHLLVARVLVAGGWPVDRIVHILRDGLAITDGEIPRQDRLEEDGAAWRSPQSVLHKVQRSGSLAG